MTEILEITLEVSFVDKTEHNIESFAVIFINFQTTYQYMWCFARFGTIWHHLCNLKNVKSTYGGVPLLAKLQVLVRRIPYALVGVTHSCALLTEAY